MPNQEQSRDGIPRKDSDRPSPDVGRKATDGQASASGTGASNEQHRPVERPMAAAGQGPAPGAESSSGQDAAREERPAKHGITSDEQPDLVAPSGVNDRDAGDRPVGGGALDFDDGTDMVHPRGKVTGAGRTWDEKHPSDAGDLGAPNAGMSDRNGPSDPDAKRGR